MSLRDKVVLVTGAGAGIGRAAALLFAHNGARVGLCDIDPVAGEETARTIVARGGQAVFVRTDVADSAAVQGYIRTVADRYERIDVLVNNAGIAGKKASLVELPESEWHRILGVNLHGTFFCCKYAVPHMIRVGGGAIVNISSVLAVASLPNSFPYTTSKAALIGLTKALARDLGVHGIRVNCILPGSTDTAMMWEGVRPEDRKAVEAEVASAQPLGRVARPQEIAQAVLLLASDEMSFVTGASLVADGGLLTRLATTR